MLKTLLVFIILVNVSEAKDFKELVNQYVKINEMKIAAVENNRTSVKGLEIIVADKSSSLASRFGHGMLRLVDDTPTWVDDVVISFSALPDEENYSIRKSITGEYPILPQVMTTHELWKMYNEEEDRALKRYVINLDDDQLQKFLDVLLKNIKKPQLLGNYSFLSNNCIGALTKIFVEAGLTKKSNKALVPTSISSWIEKNELSVYPEFVVKNHEATKKKLASLSINDLPNEDLIRKFSANELHYIYFNNNELSEEKVDFIAEHFSGESQNLNEIYDFAPVHQNLYTKCSTDSCLRKFAEDEMEHLNPSDLLRTIVYRLESDKESLKVNLQYLTFKQEILVTLKKDQFRYRSHKIVTKNDERIIELNLFDRDNKSLVQKHKLTRKDGLPAVVKTQSGVELRLISL